MLTFIIKILRLFLWPEVLFTIVCNSNKIKLAKTI